MRFLGKREGLQRVPDSRDEIVISIRPWRRRVKAASKREQYHACMYVYCRAKVVSTKSIRKARSVQLQLYSF